jgi:hypothetical protein
MFLLVRIPKHFKENGGPALLRAVYAYTALDKRAYAYTSSWWYVLEVYGDISLQVYK